MVSAFAIVSAEVEVMISVKKAFDLGSVAEYDRIEDIIVSVVPSDNEPLIVAMFVDDSDTC